MNFNNIIFLTFEDALAEVKNGNAISRHKWDSTFIFMQVPSNIPKDIIPKMTSLPEQVKEILVSRDLNLQYTDQFAKVDSLNNISSYAISVEDVLADDWYVYEEID